MTRPIMSSAVRTSNDASVSGGGGISPLAQSEGSLPPFPYVAGPAVLDTLFNKAICAASYGNKKICTNEVLSTICG